ncbi:GDPD-domain-containing protein [Pseudovirgaria hyperparasitica]|uniref:GDPD-domain-containing protein n=1 Tax=Pseudovirgaria hyperparasitica TaxID=470096 RepID=A0A6A6W289_9PEZI|nr:GDPD-domain-containing protein [Pseudovirgaria hyperparasitica]KAF2755707.1 GDPD-domain-containing protein [Pseudovirgaria hyperparasitica]
MLGDLYSAIDAGHLTHVREALHDQSTWTLLNTTRDKDGYTPLILACKNGNSRIVDLVLESGAKQDVLDHAGWTAREHAAFQGHLEVARQMKSLEKDNFMAGPAKPTATEQYRKFAFDRDDAHIVLNIGITQVSKVQPVIDLAGIDTEKDTAVTLDICTNENPEEKYHVKLPLTGDLVDNTMIFPVSNLAKARLVFRIFQDSHSLAKERRLIGCGTALLSDKENCYGVNRESLVREHIVPIMNTSTFECMGTITVTFVLAKPYPHLKSRQWDIVQALEPPRLVGHRGLGMNDNGMDRLQIGENTVQSFISAAKQGATFVEVSIPKHDRTGQTNTYVQVTRDLVPILMHNYALSESGTDIPVHELTLDQFMHISKQQSLVGDCVRSARDVDKLQNYSRRARSESRTLSEDTSDVQRRMEFTVEYMHKGFKANTRGRFIQDTFATLEQAMHDVPKEVAFNIEIKYPRRFETLVLDLAPVVLELNTFVDAILDVINTSIKNKNRKIILSSFTPDVCILLSLKQKAFPIFLISNVRQPMDDKESRCANMRVAVKFAQCWGLQGVVFLGEIFLLCPRLVHWIKNRGLIVGSYGSQNNDPANVKAQLKAGVDLIYTDRVGLNAKVLREEFGMGQQTKI